MSKNKSGWFLAGVIGAIAGALGGLLLAPKSGKETREDITRLAKDISAKIKMGAEDTKTRVKEVFGVTTQAAVAKYEEIRLAAVNKVAAVKNAGNEIDKEKYAMIVDEVIAEFKDDLSSTKTAASKMAKMLKQDWEKVKKAIG